MLAPGRRVKSTYQLEFPEAVIRDVYSSADECRLTGKDFAGRYARFGSSPEFQTDDLDGNKRSIGANPDYQCKPRFESTGRR